MGAWAAVATTAAGTVASYIAAERYEYLWIEYSRAARELRRLLRAMPAPRKGLPDPGIALLSEP